MIAPAKRVENNYNKRSTDDPEERLIEVTQNDRIIGKVSRVECHNESRKPWHRSTHIYLFSPKGKLFLSKRAKTKDTGPGQWSASAAGHVNWDEGYDEAAKVELYEELGLRLKLRRIGKIAVDFGSEREIIALYAGVAAEDKVHIQKEDEIEEIRAFDYGDVVDKFQKGTFDLSGGTRDSFLYLIKSGLLDEYRRKLVKNL